MHFLRCRLWPYGCTDICAQSRRLITVRAIRMVCAIRFIFARLYEDCNERNCAPAYARAYACGLPSDLMKAQGWRPACAAECCRGRRVVGMRSRRAGTMTLEAQQKKRAGRQCTVCVFVCSIGIRQPFSLTGEMLTRWIGKIRRRRLVSTRLVWWALVRFRKRKTARQHTWPDASRSRKSYYPQSAQDSHISYYTHIWGCAFRSARFDSLNIKYLIFSMFLLAYYIYAYHA